MSLSEALLTLDQALTEREPAATAHSRQIKTLGDLLEIPGGVIYLSDGGYSLLVIHWDSEPITVSLASESRTEVKAQWNKVLPEREAVSNLLRSLVAEWEKTYL